MIVDRRGIGVVTKHVRRAQVHHPEAQKAARRERKEVAKEGFSNEQVWLLPCWLQRQVN